MTRGQLRLSPQQLVSRIVPYFILQFDFWRVCIVTLTGIDECTHSPHRRSTSVHFLCGEMLSKHKRYAIGVSNLVVSASIELACPQLEQTLFFTCLPTLPKVYFALSTSRIQ
jgi:hypothetical protein